MNPMLMFMLKSLVTDFLLWAQSTVKNPKAIASEMPWVIHVRDTLTAIIDTYNQAPS